MNPFVEDHVDDDSPPLDLDAFIGGELTPRKLVASLVRRAALKAAGGGDVAAWLMQIRTFGSADQG